MKPIRTEADYRKAVKRIDRLAVSPDAETNEELELLTILVMAYEAEHVPDCPMEPLDYLKASMDNRGLTQTDLARSRLVEPRGGSPQRQARTVEGDDPRPRRGMGYGRQHLIGARRRAA